MATAKKKQMEEAPPQDIVEVAETVEEMVNALHRRARSSAISAVEDAIRCGNLLIEQKASLSHGEWKPWVEENCDFSYQAAARYMKAANQKSTGVDFSSLSQLYGPKEDGEPNERDAEDAQRETRDTPTQLEADIMAINTGLEAIDLPLMSVDLLIDEAGTEFLTKKARQKLDYLVALVDTIDHVRALP
jgi:hypothetical protein